MDCYIHQIVQSRLMVEEEPLLDLYNTLHHFCVSLQLEVLHTQSKRLIGMRWGDFVRIDEYVPGQRLLISYCRPPAVATQVQQKVLTECPIICIRAPKSEQVSLVLHHTPDIFIESNTLNKPGGLLLSTSCLSIEKIFSCVSKQYAVYKLNELWSELKSDSFFHNAATLDETAPFLIIKPFHDSSVNELIKNKHLIYQVKGTAKFL